MNIKSSQHFLDIFNSFYDDSFEALFLNGFNVFETRPCAHDTNSACNLWANLFKACKRSACSWFWEETWVFSYEWDFSEDFFVSNFDELS